MKKRIKYQIFRSFVAVASLSFITIHNVSAQDLPFFDTMKELTDAAVERPKPYGGTGTNSAAFTSKGAQLTYLDYSLFGAIYFKNYKFKSDRGLLITFEYMVYGGDAGSKPGGDGLSFFMFDANIANPGIGAPGAGLGYAYNRSHANQTSKRSLGLRGAYLGVGFDSYGNFKELRYQGEQRVNGMPYAYTATGSDLGDGTTLADYKGINDVTLRGAMHPVGFPQINGWGLGYAGYPVLATQRTTEDIGFKLNPTTARWEKITDRPGPLLNLPVRGGTEFEKSTDEGYRKAAVELFPDGNQGFYVSVAIKNEISLDTIIYRYHYPKELRYMENARAVSYQGGAHDNGANESSGPDWTDTNTPNFTTTLNAPAPEYFRIGFSAATGDREQPGAQRDIHIIKNLSVSLPRAAVAVDDYKDDICKGTKAITFEPLLNDYGYDGPIEVEQARCYECIDGATFRFIRPDGIAIPLPGGMNTISYVDAIVGEWTYTYDPLTNEGIVTLKPKTSYIGPANVQYDIKGGKNQTDPYAGEEYRSNIATIGVNITSTPCVERKPKIISNKMVTSRPKIIKAN